MARKIDRKVNYPNERNRNARLWNVQTNNSDVIHSATWSPEPMFISGNEHRGITLCNIWVRSMFGDKRTKKPSNCKNCDPWSRGEE